MPGAQRDKAAFVIVLFVLWFCGVALTLQACPAAVFIPEGFLETRPGSEGRLLEPGTETPDQELPGADTPTQLEPQTDRRDASVAERVPTDRELVERDAVDMGRDAVAEKPDVPSRDRASEMMHEKVTPDIPPPSKCLLLAAAIKALAIAKPGTTVTLCNGKHDINSVQKTPLLIRPGVILSGESRLGTILSHSGTINVSKGRLSSAINIIKADSARVTNLTLRGPANRNAYAGIWIEDSNFVRIERCDFFNFAMGSAGYAVLARGKTDRLFVQYNYFDGNRNGVATATGSEITYMYIRFNLFGTRPGAVGHLGAAIDNHPGPVNTQVVNNQIKQGSLSLKARNADGIVLQGTSRFNITGNTIDLNGSGRYGILLQAVKGHDDTIVGYIINNKISNVTNKTHSIGIGIVVNSLHADMKSVRVVISRNTTLQDPGLRSLHWNVLKAPARPPTWNINPNAPPYWARVTFPSATLVYP